MYSWYPHVGIQSRKMARARVSSQAGAASRASMSAWLSDRAYSMPRFHTPAAASRGMSADTSFTFWLILKNSPRNTMSCAEKQASR